MNIMMAIFSMFIFLLLFETTCACLKRVSENTHKERNVNKIRVHGPWMVDTFGRIRLFHGFNSVNKDHPYYFADMLNDTKLAYYKEWGFNVVRLGTMWAGAQPKEDVFNQTYIDTLKDIIAKLQDHGLYVIMDMHQDVLSTKYGSYDGIPVWLANKLPPSPHPYPWPLNRTHQWADGYLTQAVGRAFQDIYSNTSSALSYFSKFWSEIAKSFKSFDNVLGYELINEPWAGDIYSDPNLLLPGVAGQENLSPLYDVLHGTIRKHDTASLIFYEPVTWGVILNGKTVGSGFLRVPGGPAYKDTSVLSYHYYCWVLKPADEHHPYPYIDRAVCDEVLASQVFSAVAADIRLTGGSSFLTEFGLCDPDGNPNSTATVECNFVMAQADKYLQSWSYWDSNFFDQHGHINTNLTKAFSRPYAKAIAGVPTKMTFCPNSSRFELSFTSNKTIKKPTEIYVSPLHYPNNINVTLTEGYLWQFKKSHHVLLITPGVAAVASHVDVILLPKPESEYRREDIL